jgi:zinc protease
MLRTTLCVFVALSMLTTLVIAQVSSTASKATPPSKPKTPASPDLLPFKATERTLANGLKVIVVPTGFPNIVSIQIPVQTGSRNEVEPGKSGFAHFFEHMMFRGTKQYSPEQYNKILVQAGARSNAYTTDDYTNYHTTFAKEDLGTLLKLEADRFQHLSYSEADFRTESRAVLGEYNKDVADPFMKLLEVQHDKAFTTHTYKHTTMGFLKDIEDMPNQYQYSKEFFDRWYRPEYTTLIVAGDVIPEQVIPLVEKYWGSWQPGSFKAAIPQEPEPKGPVYAQVPWETSTLPWVTVAFHSPAFSVVQKDYAAMSLLLDLYFGPTSDLYKRLVEQEQKVDQLFPYYDMNVDPSLATIGARVKNIDDAVYVRDEILKAMALARAVPLSVQRVEDAKKNARYSLLRQLDNTEEIAATLARFVRFNRSYDTLNNLYHLMDTLTAADLHATAKQYLTDNRLVVTTLAKESFPAAMAETPSLASLAAQVAPPAAEGLRLIQQKTPLTQLNVKLLFSVGSAEDPLGKEGLAQLTASMISDAGSKEKPIDEIKKALFPLAGAFTSLADREMTTLTASIHRDNWITMAGLALPMLIEPGFREEDFKRLKDMQLSALKQDLRSNNEEELGKERLQTNLFAGTPYGHATLGTIAGIESITLEDVKDFYRKFYTQSNLTVGVAGNAPEALIERLKLELGKLDKGAAAVPPVVATHQPEGFEIEIIEKETRSTAISFGLPLPITRSHPDFAALNVARAWLGEHRSSTGQLYQRLREIRGMNYGDYAYIEAFPRGMYQFFPDPNIARRAQLFEVWIRPVLPQNAQMAIRIALYELESLIDKGLTPAQFEATRNYLMKNVYLMTATQDQQLGYALDSKWYGTGEYTAYMREQLQKLTADDVNRAVKKYLSAKNLSFVIITQDAAGLKESLLADGFSPIKYEAPKPKDLMDEDQVIGAKKLAIQPEKVRITPVDAVFAK